MLPLSKWAVMTDYRMGIYNIIHNNVSIITIIKNPTVSKDTHSCNLTPSSEVFTHPKTQQRFSMAMV